VLQTSTSMSITVGICAGNFDDDDRPDKPLVQPTESAFDVHP